MCLDIREKISQRIKGTIIAYKLVRVSLVPLPNALRGCWQTRFIYRPGWNYAEGRVDLHQQQLEAGALHVFLSYRAAKRLALGNRVVVPVRCEQADFIAAGYFHQIGRKYHSAGYRRIWIERSDYDKAVRS